MRMRRERDLRERMAAAPSFAEWKELAQELDRVSGLADERAAAGDDGGGKMYDRRLLMEKLEHLKRVRRSRDVHDIMFAIRSDLIRNVGNIASRRVPDGAGQLTHEVAVAARHKRSQCSGTVLRPLYRYVPASSCQEYLSGDNAA